MAFRWPIISACLLGALTLPTCAGTPAAPPSGSELFEAYSPIKMAPVGPISATVAASRLARWLEVTRLGRTTTIVFLPERRVRWTLTYDRLGLKRKVTTVDGATWTTSHFSYDPQGRLRGKTVTGQVTASFTYLTDSAGLVIERAREGSDERWSVRHHATGSVAETRAGSRVLRTDRFDRQGRLLSTEVGNAAAIRYERGADGELRSVVRVLRNLPERPADPRNVDPVAALTNLGAFARAGVFERHEVLLLVGSPITHSVTGSGRRRSTKDNYAKDCSRMNQVSLLRYDAADLLVDGQTTCVCGFCVAMPVPAIGRDVLGTDEHWTSGPWLRLDDVVDVTADHPVITQAGSRLAGELRPGDSVVGADGRPRILRSVRALDDRPGMRPGVNVRTRSGRFAAGGFLFASEPGRACESAR